MSQKTLLKIHMSKLRTKGTSNMGAPLAKAARSLLQLKKLDCVSACDEAATAQPA